MFSSIRALIVKGDEWLANHPHAITAGATIAATVLARFGFQANATEIVAVATAVVALVAALASGSEARSILRALASNN